MQLDKLGPAAAAAEEQKQQPPHAGDKQDPTADKLVIWNCHSNHFADRGLLSCDVELVRGGKVVWSQWAIPTDWYADREVATTIPLPKITFETVRIKSASTMALGPALCEVEVFRGPTNIARDQLVRTSSTHPNSPPPSTLTDGIKDSSQLDHGYWVAWDHDRAWIEVQVAQLKAPTSGVTIAKAVYGLGARQADVTEQLQKSVADGRYVVIQADARAFGDPAPFVPKRLVVSGSLGAKAFEFDLGENDIEPLPNFPAEGAKTAGASNRFVVLAAKYGAGSSWTDLTESVAKGVEDPKATFDPSVFTRDLPDPWFGTDKHVLVWFDHQGRRYVRIYGPADKRPLLP